MLSNSIPILLAARENHRAVAAFNLYNLEGFNAVAETAANEKAPIIIQATPSAERNAGLWNMTALANAIANHYSLPVVLHADHYTDYDRIVECIEAGYSSVMIDASALPYEDNIAMVKKVVAFAHSRGVVVEAELGHVGGVEDDLTSEQKNSQYTDPEKAVEYVKATGIDSFAVAIGTAHGQYKGEPHLDFSRLTEIFNRLKAEGGSVNVPLVLHGASCVPDEQITEAIKRGITKVNIATELKLPMANALKTFFAENPDETDPRKYMTKSKKAAAEAVMKKMRLCGSSGLVDLLK